MCRQAAHHRTIRKRRTRDFSAESFLVHSSQSCTRKFNHFIIEQFPKLKGIFPPRKFIVQARRFHPRKLISCYHRQSSFCNDKLIPVKNSAGKLFNMRLFQ